MLRRRVIVTLEREVVLRPAADRDRGRVERSLLARVERRAADDDEPAGTGHRRVRHSAQLACLRRPEDEALLRQTEILARGSDDAPDEQVEENDEGDLEDEQKLLDRNRGEGHVRLPSTAGR